MNVVWKRSTNGANAYVGEIKIGGYYWNIVDSRNGRYKVVSILPLSTLNTKINVESHARELIEGDFNTFMKKLSK
jgi:hypothetical protein